MQITKTHLRAAAFVVGGAAVGAIATAASSAGRGEPKPFVGEALGAAAATAAPEVGALQSAPGTSPTEAAAAARRSAPASDAALDPRLFASPLSERFTQWSRGASNPGVRQAPHRDPLSEMIAAVFPTDESVRTVMLAPRVNPPPPPPDEDDEETEEPCDDEPGCDGGDICPPPGDTCEPPPNGVPEIDADLLGSGLLLLVGGALVLASRRTL